MDKLQDKDSVVHDGSDNDHMYVYSQVASAVPSSLLNFVYQADRFDVFLFIFEKYFSWPLLILILQAEANQK